MKKISDCQTLSYSKTVPVEFEKNFLSVTLGSLRTACAELAKRTTFKFVNFQQRLRILKKVENFSRKFDIFQREIRSSLRTVSGRVNEKFPKSLKIIYNHKTDSGIHFSNDCSQRNILLDLQDLSSLVFLFRGEHCSLLTVFLILGNPVSL